MVICNFDARTDPIYAELLKFLLLPAIAAFAELTTPGSQTQSTVQIDEVGFEIRVNGTLSSLPLISASSMPGEAIEIEVPKGASIAVSAGEISEEGGKTLWTAPDNPGLEDMTISFNGQESRVNLFVLTPFRNGVEDTLNGYRIGKYAQPLRNMSSYAVPRGFIDLTAMSDDVRVSPNFKLGQFRCKQQPGHEPTYLLVRPEMLVKLEIILEAANEKGWEADTFFVMSGYRTPFYNAAIGNTTTSSRHLYGDAADIYIDLDRDGQMDDLDGNGRIEKADAYALVALIEDLSAKKDPRWVPGGGAAYGANAAHGPFVHVDTRGYKARW
ncbi:D-Ala-D-Ala carboxypeptidase family metallohydrolase [Hyphomonas pacifica]|uniref:D-Ala-D-Ala carboxypeptidase family metallohydrolase n=1 Tax=Hyphomonas pacifica TaxID=1280941 RepID=UPI000DBFF06D|nr:D-Ala-D-Ala carboxypeptidase family metallohydrolase [Hyphomonas pacifica]RAN37316.1 hypothetical protein HY11_09480 [Hyphomonas pacifica]